MTFFWVVLLAALGLIFGSFANALVWRLHAQDELAEKIEKLKAKKKRSKGDDKKLAALQAEQPALSMSKGRSMCSHCRHPLAAKDLVPLFSWLWLRGKCRYCHQPIQDTPLLEAGLPVLYLLSFFLWPLPLSGYGLVFLICWLAVLVGFVVLAVYDLRWFLLPDKVVLPLAGLALVPVLVHTFAYHGGPQALWTAFWGVIVCSGIFYVLHIVSNGTWIGGGDVKLGIALGLLVGGPLQGMLVIFVASVFGTLASVPLLLKKELRRNSVIPFGPFLLLATFVVLLFGQQAVDWFNNLLITV